MNRKINFCSVALLFASVSALSYQSMHLEFEEDLNLLQNIYNEPLKQCGSPSMNTGSWDSEYKCSQPNGGVHQLCIERIAQTTNKFSLNTGQTDWSTSRGDENHCVCLGAWSLYVARKNNKQIQDDGKRQLKCDAIPRIALTKNYVKNFSKKGQYSYQGWQRWNGLQLQDQIVDGVNQLFKQCSQNISLNQLNSLKSNYCSFAKGISSIEASELYLANCSSSLNI